MAMTKGKAIRWTDVPPNEKARQCSDCYWCRLFKENDLAMMLCANEEATAFRNTNEPYVCKCDWWEPRKRDRAHRRHMVREFLTNIAINLGGAVLTIVLFLALLIFGPMLSYYTFGWPEPTPYKQCPTCGSMHPVYKETSDGT